MSELLDTPKHADLIYDVGMHRGEDTAFYLRKGFRVVAVEADPELAAGCRTRFRDALASGRLTIAEGAIVEADPARPMPARVAFFKNDNSVWGTVRGDWAERNARLGTASCAVEVAVIDFVQLLSAHGVPHYLKVDIEGLDLVCIGALRAFRARPDYVSIETDKTSLASMRREVDVLSALGYDGFQAVEQSVVPQSRVPDPAREGACVAHRFEEGASGLFGAELDDAWKSAAGIMCQLRAIRLGYYLLGDDGIMNRWRFRGMNRLRAATTRWLQRYTGTAVPGWHDTHARLAVYEPSKPTGG